MRTVRVDRIADHSHVTGRGGDDLQRPERIRARFDQLGRIDQVGPTPGRGRREHHQLRPEPGVTGVCHREGDVESLPHIGDRDREDRTLDRPADRLEHDGCRLGSSPGVWMPRPDGRGEGLSGLDGADDVLSDAATRRGSARGLQRPTPGLRRDGGRGRERRGRRLFDDLPRRDRAGLDARVGQQVGPRRWQGVDRRGLTEDGEGRRPARVRTGGDDIELAADVAGSTLPDHVVVAGAARVRREEVGRRGGSERDGLVGAGTADLAQCDVRAVADRRHRIRCHGHPGAGGRGRAGHERCGHHRPDGDGSKEHAPPAMLMMSIRSRGSVGGEVHSVQDFGRPDRRVGVVHGVVPSTSNWRRILAPPTWHSRSVKLRL